MKMESIKPGKSGDEIGQRCRGLGSDVLLVAGEEFDAEVDTAAGDAADGCAAIGLAGAEGVSVAGFGAETPAMPEPRPSFCRLVASSFPLGSRPLAD